jgi:hypothetical protein
MKRFYVVLVERTVDVDGFAGATGYVRLGVFKTASPAAARRRAADDFGFANPEELIAVPERYWQSETFVPERPTLGVWALSP